MKDVAVIHDHNGRIETIAEFDTVQEAEHFIAIREYIDPKGVRAGHYGIDAGCLNGEKL